MSRAYRDNIIDNDRLIYPKNQFYKNKSPILFMSPLTIWMPPLCTYQVPRSFPTRNSIKNPLVCKNQWTRRGVLNLECRMDILCHMLASNSTQDERKGKKVPIPQKMSIRSPSPSKAINMSLSVIMIANFSHDHLTVLFRKSWMS